MSYEFYERVAQTEQRRLGAQPAPITTETFLHSSEARLGGTVGSNPHLDTKTGKGQRRPHGPGPDHMGGKMAGHPSPISSGVEADNCDSASSAHFISARARMGKGRASPERDPMPETTPAGFVGCRHNGEGRGKKTSGLIPSDHVVHRETGATWTPRKGTTSPTRSGAAPVTLHRRDTCELSPTSPWQRPFAEGGLLEGSEGASWRQIGSPDVEPASLESQLSGSPSKSSGQWHLPHMAISDDSPWPPGTQATTGDTPAEDDVYFERQALRDELLGLNIRALRGRAASAGLEKEQVENTIDLSEDPRAALIALIVESK